MILENPQQSCQEWQQRLKLQDWDISVKVVPHRESEGAWGNVRWNLQEKFADIKLLDPNDQSDGMRPYCMEETLVHELLHLHFALFDADANTPEQLAQEQAINALARALVNLKNANLLPQGDTLNPSPAA
ncbi:hypothetical protein [Dendronalium sp. ChiSLP03b]|uniref:hypothetical protein n=1 Tax=Dendronalium sp. ChiSLP03b TaxID=3075381 RepID=UPI00391D4C0B